MNKRITDYTFDQNEIIGAFVRLIKENREIQNLSVRELGAKAGVSYTVVYDLENKNILPKVETINKLADALGLSINIKCHTIDNAPSLAIFYCKAGHEKESLVKCGITPISSKTKISNEEQFKTYLIKKGLYQKDIEEVENFIQFKLSMHK